MYRTILHVLQVVAFCCGNDILSVMPEFPHAPMNSTDKFGPNSNACNVSSETDCLESLPGRRLIEGCSVPLSRPTPPGQAVPFRSAGLHLQARSAE